MRQRQPSSSNNSSRLVPCLLPLVIPPCPSLIYSTSKTSRRKSWKSSNSSNITKLSQQKPHLQQLSKTLSLRQQWPKSRQLQRLRSSNSKHKPSNSSTPKRDSSSSNNKPRHHQNPPRSNKKNTAIASKNQVRGRRKIVLGAPQMPRLQMFLQMFMASHMSLLLHLRTRRNFTHHPLKKQQPLHLYLLQKQRRCVARWRLPQL
mmetsp:Transcript_35870/g.54448  ORF Transcript_35870/g.54448 Transcript_35870/m.54448 type:complete len:203 (+) Transcript_35870:643-1251(+)